MIKRGTIGKIQIALGILLIIGIIAVSYNVPQFFSKAVEGTFTKTIDSTYVQNSNNETKTAIVAIGSMNFIGAEVNLLTNLLGFAAIAFILAVMLILQGLANISEMEK